MLLKLHMLILNQLNHKFSVLAIAVYIRDPNNPLRMTSWILTRLL